MLSRSSPSAYRHRMYSLGVLSRCYNTQSQLGHTTQIEICSLLLTNKPLEHDEHRLPESRC